MAEQRQRTERTEEERQQRRRRHDGNIDASQRLNLVIPPEIEARLKAEGLTPRWVNDVGSRIANLTQRDDYDTVDGVAPVPVVVDKKKGTTVMAHLLAKRSDFIAEDRAKADEPRRAAEKAMLKGKVKGPDGELAPVSGQHGAEVYVDKASTIGRENRIIE